MPRKHIDRLIVNSPYEEPSQFWRYQRETRLFDLADGRRSAGYVIATPDSKSFDDPGVFVEIPLVNRIRPRVRAWREAGYPGVTAVTRRLLAHWTDPEEFENRRFFFCQLEAAETMIWLAEAPATERVGIEIPGDGGDFRRLCAKMATGSGKTVVMAMLIAWQVLNRVAYPRDTRFSKNVLVIAPGLTVKKRLAVLKPSDPGNYYEAFRIIPPSYFDRLRGGSVLVRNWHVLAWETAEQLAKQRTVDRRGEKSDEAYVRDVLEDMSDARNLLVINDEAHHAWRVSGDSETEAVDKSDIEEATRWIAGLDRIHRSRRILACYDFSATPFAPSGKQSSQEALFDWIVSDFGLNDAIESGLVKTPRIVVRDDALPDANTYKSRLYHIYMDPSVKDDLNRKAEPHDPLPDLVVNAYYLLGFDWRECKRAWGDAGFPTPPVMITVANRTETAARVKYMFDHKRVNIDELRALDQTLHIDSRVLTQAETTEIPIAELDQSETKSDDAQPGLARKLTKKGFAERLRTQVNTVGKIGKLGAEIQNVISVGMLSEGWDAKTVTHIMGLRAFSSQLLCEQVVGRGLRRTSYEVGKNGLFSQEHVNIFGVPFAFLPHESQEDGPAPAPPEPKTAIHPVAEKSEFQISWPNVVRIERVPRPTLDLDWDIVEPLDLDASQTAQRVDLAAVLEGKTFDDLTSIDLRQLAKDYRTQRIIFEVASRAYGGMKKELGTHPKPVLLGQFIRLIARFIRSDRIRIHPRSYSTDDLRRRLVITLNMNRVVQQVRHAVRVRNTMALEPLFDPDRPIRSTGDMMTWYTGRPCQIADRSHINLCVYDSTWEASDEFALSRSPDVKAWVKNDHLGFEVLYVHRGIVRKYRPDFLVRLTSGHMLILETKGRGDDPKTRAKHRSCREWTEAVNAHGAFGRWSFAVASAPGQVQDILAAHAADPSR